MATAKNKLPKELQTFKREMKKATFEEKVERYFSISYVIEEYSGQKKDIIISLFNPAEKYTFYNEYYPLRKAIEANEDKVRTVKSVIDFTAYFIDSLLRIASLYTYMGEFTDYALEYLKEETGKDNGKTAKHLKSLRSVTPGFDFKYNRKSGKYELRSGNFTNVIESNIKGLKKGIATIKAYFDSLREFLEAAGKPQLFPKEFKSVENQLITRFDNRIAQMVEKGQNDPRRETDYPQFRTATDLEKKVISIDYMETEAAEGYMGDKNPWIRAYNSYVVRD